MSNFIILLNNKSLQIDQVNQLMYRDINNSICKTVEDDKPIYDYIKRANSNYLAPAFNFKDKKPLRTLHNKTNNSARDRLMLTKTKSKTNVPDLDKKGTVYDEIKEFETRLMEKKQFDNCSQYFPGVCFAEE